MLLLLCAVAAAAATIYMLRMDSRKYLLVTTMASMLAFVVTLILLAQRMDAPTNDEKPAKTPGDKSVFAIENISDGVMIINKQGIVELFNPAASEISGWSVTDAKSLDYRSIMKLVDADDHEIPPSENPITTALVQGESLSRDDLSLQTASEKRIQIDLQITPTDNGGIIVVFRNITAAKKAEHDKTEFISTASHEMRTPVAIIEGYIGMLLNPATATVDARGLDYAQKAHESAQHLGRLFQDLLDVTKADDNRIQFTPTLIDCAAFAQQMVADFSQQAAEKNLSLQYDAGSGMQPIYVVYLDQDHLREILQNIIENAIKYTPSGSVTIRVGGDQDRARFSVSDTGIGIEPEDAKHLFQKFYRVDNSDTREIGGTGLGLYLTKKLTEEMGGRIGVDSVYGKGSTFWVEFNRISRDEAMQKAAEIKARQEKNQA